MVRILRIVAVLSSALLLAACGGHSRNAAPVQAQAPAPDALQSALAELDALETPEGVDAALFEELKGALASQLESRPSISAGKLSSRDSSNTHSRLENRDSGYGRKTVAAAPTGSANMVNDLTIWSEDEQLSLMWHYYNVGDYDQNGAVGISDITPLAIHYDEEWGDVNSIQAVIDGSGNKKIGIEDITPIAQNYGVECAGYVLQNSATPDPEDPGWNSIGDFGFALASGIGRYSFVVSAEVGEHPYYRVVPYDVSSVVGVPGEVVEFVPEPPLIESVNPQSGVSGDTIVITVTASGATPMAFYWDMGGGAVPNKPEGSSPMVTLDAVNTYDANVTAINGAGSDVYPFTLDVTEPVVDPPEIVSVTPSGGEEGALVEFSAVVNGTPPFVYYWDFGGGAVPNTPVDESPEVTLGTAGEYAASLRVENAADENTFPFALTVTGEPPGPMVIDELGGDYPSAAIIEGNPAVAYRQSSSAYYVRALDSYGTTWGDPVKIPDDGGSFPGAHNSLCIVNENPAVSTSIGFMIEAGAVRYSRATDALGSSWNELSQIWNADTMNSPPSGLEVVSGYPAIAIAQDDFSGNNDLLFYRAEDANGDIWPTEPVTVASDVVSSGILACQLLNVGGYLLPEYPAILLSAGELRFVRASDATGSTWESPVVIETMSSSAAACILQDLPAIVWSRGGELPRTLLYVRSTDEHGNDWAEKVTLDDTIECWGRIGFAAICGRPAVAYANGPWDNRRLHYVVAEDGLGESWGTPIVVDAETFIRENVSLLEVNGSPAIFYCGSEGSGTLRYIRALDNFGLEWPE